MPRATKPRRNRRKTGPSLPYTDDFGDWEMGEDGIKTCWRTAKDTANDLGITTRRLQQLEGIGMPARGHRGTCRYRWPHVTAWWIAYQIRIKRGERVAHIDVDDAMDEDTILNALEMAESDNRMRRDPEHRAEVLALEAED